MLINVFFLQLCIAMKVKYCIEIAKNALDTDHSVVIGLFTTGESSLDESLSKSLHHEELLSAPYLLAESFLKKWFPGYIKPDSQQATIQQPTNVSINSQNDDILDFSLFFDPNNNNFPQQQQQQSQSQPNTLMNNNNPITSSLFSNISPDLSFLDFDMQDNNNNDPNNNSNHSPIDELQSDQGQMKIFDRLLKELKEICLPDNPLDELIHSLGGISNVAEITGRSQRLVYNKEKNNFIVERRNPKKENNLECSLFMKGKKKIAIISEAASTGISLHASNSCKNQLKRMHIILQLPWSAEKAVQQLGRTHRSYQVSPPHYKLIISELGGERRLASVVASRLGALGALTSGDRRATSACDALSEFVILPKYGCEAIEKILNYLNTNQHLLDSFKQFKLEQQKKQQQSLQNNNPFTSTTSTTNTIHSVFPPQLATNSNQLPTFDLDNIALLYALTRANQLGAFGSLKNDSVKRFLNRILGLTVEDQKIVFSEFIEQYDNCILKSQMDGSYDDGIYDILGDVTTEKEIIYTHPSNPIQKTYSLEIDVKRGISWSEAIRLLNRAYLKRQENEKKNLSLSSNSDQNNDDQETSTQQEAANKSNSYLPNGFYENKRTHHIILAVQLLEDPKKYHIVRPHLGHQSMPRNHSELKKRYRRLTSDAAKERWIQKYNKEISSKHYTDEKSKDSYGIISGSILPTCHILRNSLGNTKFSIVRILCSWKNREERVVGILVPKDKLPPLKKALLEYETKGYSELQFERLLEQLNHNFKQRGEKFIKAIPSADLQAFLNCKGSKVSLRDAVQEVEQYLFREKALFDELRKYYNSNSLKIAWNNFMKFKDAQDFLLGKTSLSCEVVVKNFYNAQRPLPTKNASVTVIDV